MWVVTVALIMGSMALGIYWYGVADYPGVSPRTRPILLWQDLLPNVISIVFGLVSFLSFATLGALIVTRAKAAASAGSTVRLADRARRQLQWQHALWRWSRRPTRSRLGWRSPDPDLSWIPPAGLSSSSCHPLSHRAAAVAPLAAGGGVRDRTDCGEPSWRHRAGAAGQQAARSPGHYC
jgi:hypothetical protein